MGEYSQTFQSPEAARDYEDVVYGKDSHDTWMWSLQRQRLLSVVEDLRREHGRLAYLDFACGTGRVISILEGVTDNATGIDISASMIALARTKVRRSSLMVGTIRDARLADERYELITAFRFFLNAEPQLRKATMAFLASHLRNSTSRLVFNVQGNKHSVRHLSIAARSLLGEAHNEMSLGDVAQLVDGAGLEIDSWYGFGIAPAFLYRTMLRPMAKSADGAATRWPSLGRFCYDLLFVCRLRHSSV